jgi:hypothetical protein
MKVLAKKLFDKDIDVELFNQTLKSVSELEVPDTKPISDFYFLDGLIANVKDDGKKGKKEHINVSKKVSQLY